MTTIGEAISRVRATLKAVKEDPFLTDRSIYLAIIKYGETLLKREDNQYKLMRMSSIWTDLPYVELIDVDKIEAKCAGIYSDCYIKRTKYKLPRIFDGTFGPLIRSVSSIDGSQELYRTEPGTYTSITKTTTFKYNNQKYFWSIDEYLYLPDCQWDAIKVEALFDANIAEYHCDDKNKCKVRQDNRLPFPEYIFSEIEQYVVKDFTMSMQIPTNGPDDSQNILR
jgi:hypothetical protein